MRLAQHYVFPAFSLTLRSGTTSSASVSLSFACCCKLMREVCFLRHIAMLACTSDSASRLWIKWPPKNRGLSKRGELGISIISPLLSPNVENSMQTPDHTPHRSNSHSERKSSARCVCTPILCPDSVTRRLNRPHLLPKGFESPTPVPRAQLFQTP